MGVLFTLCFEVEVMMEITGANLSCAILNAEFQIVTIIFSWDHDVYLHLTPGKHVIRATCEGLNLTPGSFNIGTGINQSTESVAWDLVQNLPLFEVKNVGKVFHWLHRQWGSVQCDNVSWCMETVCSDEITDVPS
jgi:hypothetical protein